MKLHIRVNHVILNYLQRVKLDPDMRPDIRPDIRFSFTNRQNCTKFGMHSQNVIIKKRNNFDYDPTIFGSVIPPDV